MRSVDPLRSVFNTAALEVSTDDLYHLLSPAPGLTHCEPTSYGARKSFTVLHTLRFTEF